MAEAIMFRPRLYATRCFITLPQLHWRHRVGVLTKKSCPTRRENVRTVLIASQVRDYANQIVRIRMARQADIEEMSRVTAQAFCDQDETLLSIQSKLGPRFDPVMRQVASIFERLFKKEVATQLRKRVGTNHRAHIVLLAENPESGLTKGMNISPKCEQHYLGEMMGCVEIGVVPVQEMSGARTSDAIRYWDQSIAKMAAMGVKDDTNHDSARSGKDANEGDEKLVADYIRDNNRVPYIGNLAVSQGFRRRGVASALVTEACTWAGVLWGAPCVWLHVEVCNEAATSLYKKLGFGCESRDPEWIDGVGRRQRLFLRSSGGAQDWSQARLASIKLNVWEYIRWCWLDLERVRKERERL